MIEQFLQQPELNWKKLSIKRNDYLIVPGEIEKYIYFVVKGAVRAYLQAEEEEFTIRFGYTNSIITAIPSYFNDLPTELNIQAIRKTELLRCSKKEFESFIQTDMKLLLIYQGILKELVSSFFEREIDLLTKSPTERLDRLFKRSPQLFQEVPHKYIASYLRMTPETLSRLLTS